MREQYRRGRLKYLSFVILDIGCLIISNVLAVLVYLCIGTHTYEIEDYVIVVAYMVVIDVAVTLAFNTLDRVLRRRKKKEIIESIKHVAISFVLLALFLFSTKQGALFSRVTIYFSYTIYLVAIIVARIAWKEIIKANRSFKQIPSSLLVTTVGYAPEGIGVVENAGMTVKGMFITDKTNEGIIRNIPVIVDRKDAAAFLCWEWIDRVYICGPDNIDVPENLQNACDQMGISVFYAPVKKNFDYEVVKIRTALSKDDRTTGLSFFEGEHDIPFRISRLYTIYESEQDNQKGFHAHKQSWHLLFCPYGIIDIFIDTGKEKKTITLDDPSVGVILHPSVWREMYWKTHGSVLCVAASGHYDADKLRNDYSEYNRFLQEREWSATIESAEIMGEVII